VTPWTRRESWLFQIKRWRLDRRTRRIIAYMSPASAGPLAVRFVRRRWPPFFSTLFFLPRLKMVATNNGDPYEFAVLRFEVRPYVAAASGGAQPPGWTETQHREIGHWRHDETKTFGLKMHASSLPEDGTYEARVRVSESQVVEAPVFDGLLRLDVGRQSEFSLHEYFRVEPASTVLTFWAVVGTLITAAAALGAAIASLVR
jgi:hypothetical protein